jgi:hypothetical protein
MSKIETQILYAVSSSGELESALDTGICEDSIEIVKKAAAECDYFDDEKNIYIYKITIEKIAKGSIPQVICWEDFNE